MAINTEQVSRLGFGLMRLPVTDGEIDIAQVKNMVDAYLAAGLKYFDTAYMYHSGASETAIHEALVSRYPRDAYFLADKLPVWMMKESGDKDVIFEDQLKKTGAGYFDFYLLHSLENGSNYENLEKYGCFEWALQKKAEGKIRHFGFSFHGDPELLNLVLDKHPEVEFVQIQLNYLDWENPVVQSGALYQILLERGIPMVIMEPVKGGTLASLPDELEAKYKAVRPDASIASWALRFVASLPGVMTVLSGMSSEEQMLDNLRTFSHFEPLSDEEKALVEEVRAVMTNIPLIGCTSCRYCCDGCPMGIPIPDILRALNGIRRYPNDTFRMKSFYGHATEGKGKASECIACGQCEGVCPQHLPVIELLKEASEKIEAAAL